MRAIKANRRRRQSAGRSATSKQRDRLRRSSPLGRFIAQRSAARQRGIPFLLTFGEWWQLWEPHWHQRGRGRGKYCMARLNDAGPYTVSNVRIITTDQNQRERTLPVGSKHPQAKLREADIPVIRGLWATGQVSIRELAELHGAGRGAIAGVISGKTWKHVQTGNQGGLSAGQ